MLLNKTQSRAPAERVPVEHGQGNQKLGQGNLRSTGRQRDEKLIDKKS